VSAVELVAWSARHDQAAPAAATSQTNLDTTGSATDNKQTVKMVKVVKDKMACFWQKWPEKIKRFQYLCPFQPASSNRVIWSLQKEKIL
jgi:hypothetical protein